MTNRERAESLALRISNDDNWADCTTEYVKRTLTESLDTATADLRVQLAAVTEAMARAEKSLRASLANKDAHDSWCSAKNRCGYCDPITDALEAMGLDYEMPWETEAPDAE